MPEVYKMVPSPPDLSTVSDLSASSDLSAVSDLSTSSDSNTNMNGLGREPMVNGQPLLGPDGQPMVNGQVNGQPLLGPDGQPLLGPDGQVNGQQQSNQLSEEHREIIQKEEEIISKIQEKGSEYAKQTDSESSDEETVVGKAIALYMVFVKTYFALMLKVGDTGAKSLIQMFLPGDVSEQVLSDNPDMSKVVKTFSKLITLLENPEFRKKIAEVFGKLRETVEPQVMKLFNGVLKVFIDVAEKNASKLIITLVNTLTAAFPPFAVVVDAAALISAGLHTAASGLHLVGMSTDSLAKMKDTVFKTIDDFTKTIDSMTNFPSNVKKTMENPLLPTVVPTVKPVPTVVPTVVPAIKPAPIKGGASIRNLQGQTKKITNRILKTLRIMNHTNKIKHKHKKTKTKKYRR